MIIVGSDGRPKAVKMEVAGVDGYLESASHADKVLAVDVEYVYGWTLPPVIEKLFKSELWWLG